MSKGVRFHYEFSTGDHGTTPNDAELTIEHGNGETTWMKLTGVMAVKNSLVDHSGRVTEFSVLTRQEGETCVYRISQERVVVDRYYGYENHWEVGYDRFIRDGGWAGNMDPHPEATTTTVNRVMP